MLKILETTTSYVDALRLLDEDEEKFLKYYTLQMDCTDDEKEGFNDELTYDLPVQIHNNEPLVDETIEFDVEKLKNAHGAKGAAAELEYEEHKRNVVKIQNRRERNVLNRILGI